MPTFQKKLAMVTILLTVWVCGQAGLYQVRAQDAKNDIVYTRTDLENYIGKWHRRDGAAAALISDYFCDFLQDETALFLAVMAEHPQCFSEWLHDLPNLSFTDYGGCVNLECFRTGMLDALQIAEIPSKLQPMADRLKEVLMKTKIRRID